MTNQELFDFCYQKVVEQGRPSSEMRRIPDRYGGYYERYRCFYRGPNGTKCAIGHLIPDDQYDPVFDAGDNLDDYSVFGIYDRVPALAGFNKYLLADIQRAHDCADVGAGFVESFTRLMREVAETAKLDPSVLES